MAKTKVFYSYVFFLSLSVILLSGCVYITHLNETMYLKSLEANEKEKQAALDRQERLYNKLKADIDSGRLDKTKHKRKIFSIYGVPTLCKPAEGENGVKETCVYRRPTGGLLTEVILLNFDARDKLSSWKMQNSGK